MFEEMVVSTTKKKGTKPWTFVVSMIFEIFFLTILILIPLIYTEALPKTLMSSILLAPPPPPPPPPPPAAVQVVHVKPVAHLMDAGKLVAPKAIPKDIKIIKEEAEPPDDSAVSPVACRAASRAAPWAAYWWRDRRRSSDMRPPTTKGHSEARHSWWSTCKLHGSSTRCSLNIRHWLARRASAARLSCTPSSVRMAQ